MVSGVGIPCRQMPKPMPIRILVMSASSVMHTRSILECKPSRKSPAATHRDAGAGERYGAAMMLPLARSASIRSDE